MDPRSPRSWWPRRRALRGWLTRGLGPLAALALGGAGGCATTAPVQPTPERANLEPQSPAPPPSRHSLLAQSPTATADDGAGATVGASAGAATGAYVHGASGMQFPREVEGFERDGVDHFDGGEDDVSVAYHHATADSILTTTVYVYPAAGFAGGLAQHYEESKAAVLGVASGGELIAEGTMRFEQNGVPHPGLRAHFLIRDPKGVAPTRISHLFLFQHGRWFIKYRAMFLAFQHTASDRALARFMRALVWPDGGPTLVAEWIEPGR